MHVLITGFFFRQNFGDDLYEAIYRQVVQNVSLSLVSCDDLKHWTPADKVDLIILGGGDVLNDYFLTSLWNVIERLRYTGPLVGLSVGVPYASVTRSWLQDKLVFDRLYIRSQSGYTLLKRELKGMSTLVEWVPDLSVMIPDLFDLSPRSYHQPVSKPQRIGIALAQPILKAHPDLIHRWASLVTFWLQDQRDVVFLPFNTLGTPSEDDIRAQRAVLDLVGLDHKQVTCIERRLSIREMWDWFIRCDVIVASRFHAHMLALLTQVPCISMLATTSKVQALCDEFHIPQGHPDDSLERLCACVDQASVIPVKERHEASQQWSQRFEQLWTLHQDVKRAHLAQFQIHDTIHHVLQKVAPLVSCQPDSFLDVCRVGTWTHPELIASMLCYGLLHITHPRYHWGLAEKLKTPPPRPFDLEEECAFILRDFHHHHQQNDPPKSVMNGRFDLEAIVSIREFEGRHRAGWPYVVQHLSAWSQPGHPLLLDHYVDRTFLWGSATLQAFGALPYRQPWMGFVHHTFWPDAHDLTHLLENPLFQASLPWCRGLWVLSKSLQAQLQPKVTCPVLMVTHPMEFPSKRFSLKQFLSQPDRMIIQIGSWLRRTEAIQELHIESLVTKAWLAPPQDAPSYPGVRSLPQLTDEEYDHLLSQNLVFLQLYDMSACNTVLEAVVRQTPVLINRLPAAVEILGESYPFFYETLHEASSKAQDLGLIAETYDYLQKLDVTPLSIGTFLQKVLADIMEVSK